MPIHRALLTGLLSFIAQKSMTSIKQQANQKPNAASMSPRVSTKPRFFLPVPCSNKIRYGWWRLRWLRPRRCMRTAAKIEPEWILAMAGDLLKIPLFWAALVSQNGSRQGYAQISLFGLIVVHKQLMNYERVNLSESRNLFARCLGLGNLNAPSTGMVKGASCRHFAA